MSDSVEEQAVFETARRGKVQDLKEALLGDDGKTPINPDGYLTYDGSSALHLAVMGSFAECVEVLLNANPPADIQLQKEDLSNVFHLCSSGARGKSHYTGSTDSDHSPAALTARVLIKHLCKGAQLSTMVNARNEDSLTSLHLAAYYGDLSLVKVLVEEGGADVTKRGEEGTALDMVEASRDALRQYLIARMKAAGIDDPENYNTRVGPANATEGISMNKITERFGYGAFDGEEMPFQVQEGAKSNPVSATNAPTKNQTSTCSHCFMNVIGIAKSMFSEKKPATDELAVSAGVGSIFSKSTHVSDTIASTLGTERAYKIFWEKFEQMQGVVDANGDNSISVKLSKTQQIFGRQLYLSPMGFGSHYCTGNLQDPDEDMLKKVVCKLGVNVIDTAVNYGDGGAEKMIGRALQSVFEKEESLARESVFLISKVGNVVGAENINRCKEVFNNATSSSPSFSTLLAQKPKEALTFHCLDPKWIKEEVGKSLERLQVEKLDCVLLHNPETFLWLIGGFDERKEGESKVDVKFPTNVGENSESQLANTIMAQASETITRASLEGFFYREVIFNAFVALEELRQVNKIAYYGVSGAFYPLRPTEPQHLLFLRLVEEANRAFVNVAAPHCQSHGFRVVQTPLNFAEIGCVSLEQVRRKGNGSVLRGEEALQGDATYNATKPLADLCNDHNVYLLTNRPLSGVLGELRGVLRFTSHRLPMNSELQSEDVDELEMKLSRWLKLSGAGAAESEDDFFDSAISGQFSGKTMLILAYLALLTPTTVLTGCFRRDEYLVDVFSVLANAGFGIKEQNDGRKGNVKEILEAMNRSLTIWFQMAQDVQEDHGTAKDWRLPVKGSAVGGIV